jgi:hypothetical protein
MAHDGTNQRPAATLEAARADMLVFLIMTLHPYRRYPS